MSPSGAPCVNFAAIHLCPQIQWHVRTSSHLCCDCFQRHRNAFCDFDIWMNNLPLVFLIMLFFTQVSIGQRMERRLTQAVTQSWRFLKTLAHLYSTHAVILWTTWGSTKANTYATHPTCWGQQSLMRPDSPWMVRRHSWLITTKTTTELLKYKVTKFWRLLITRFFYDLVWLSECDFNPMREITPLQIVSNISNILWYVFKHPYCITLEAFHAFYRCQFQY